MRNKIDALPLPFRFLPRQERFHLVQGVPFFSGSIMLAFELCTYIYIMTDHKIPPLTRSDELRTDQHS